MPDTTTHSQDPHDPAELSHVDKARQNVREAEAMLQAARQKLHTAQATKERATKTSRNAASREAAWSQTPENVDPKAWAAGLRQIDSFFNFDEPLVDLVERLGNIAGKPSNLRRRPFLDEDLVEQALHDPHDSLVVRVVLVDERVDVSHETSPSVDDAGAHSVGDGLGAGDASATPATEVTAESLVEAVRDARVDESAADRVRRDARANLAEADDNFAYAKNRSDTARSALYDFINRGIK